MALHHNPKIVTSGLVLCLDAGNIRSYPGSGTTWYDLSGNGNHGTLVNGITFSSADGGSFVFDGSSDYVDLPVSSTLNNLNGQNLTVCAYVKPNALPSGSSSLFTPRGSTNNELDVGFATGNLPRLDRYPPSGGPAVTSTIAFATAQWQFFAASAVSGTSVTFFRDGATEVETHTEIYTGNAPTKITIAAQFLDGTSGRYYSGSISSMLVYNRNLSNDEVLQNFHATRGRYGI